jgi:hypothetical protein
MASDLSFGVSNTPAAGKDTFRRNGFELSWGSAVIKVDNEEYFGITGVDYEEKLERTFVRGTGRDGVPRGMTRGQYSVEGSSIKMYKSSALALLEKLAADSADGKSYGQTPFFFSLDYEEDDVSLTEELYDCRITGRKASIALGAEGLIDEIQIMVLYAKLTTPNIEGMTLFDNRNGRL